jgi:ssDNA-binding replication factor A large subunit
MNDAALVVREIHKTITGARPRPPTPISTLRPGSQGVVEAAVARVWPPREVKRASGAVEKIHEAILDDGTGKILLVLESGRPRGFSVGEWIRIVDGTVMGYSGHPRIVVGPTARIKRVARPPAEPRGGVPNRPGA